MAKRRKSKKPTLASLKSDLKKTKSQLTRAKTRLNTSERNYKIVVDQNDDFKDRLQVVRRDPAYCALTDAYAQHMGPNSKVDEPMRCAEETIVALRNRGDPTMGFTELNRDALVKVVNIWGQHSKGYMSAVRDAVVYTVEHLKPQTFWGKRSPLKTLE